VHVMASGASGVAVRGETRMSRGRAARQRARRVGGVLVWVSL
jgi:hypothetical protein